MIIFQVALVAINVLGDAVDGEMASTVSLDHLFSQIRTLRMFNTVAFSPDVKYVL